MEKQESLLNITKTRSGLVNPISINRFETNRQIIYSLIGTDILRKKEPYKKYSSNK